MLGKLHYDMPERSLGGVRAESPIRKKPPVGISRELGEECGGPGGVPYRVFAADSERLRRIVVWHRQYVDGIQLETDNSILPRIGGTGKHRDVHEDRFELEADEYLTGITVEYWNYIDRITFHTNKRRYGPYGGTAGRIQKTLRAPAGKMVSGFTGRHWDFIDSIQLIVQ